MAERVDRGDTAWGWVVRGGSFVAFLFSAIVLPLKGQTPNFGVAFLAICGAAFPTKEFRALLRGWRNGRNGGNGD